MRRIMLCWLVVVALMGISSQAEARCDVIQGGRQTVTFDSPGELTVPRDIPKETPIFTDRKSLFPQDIYFDCYAQTSLYGMLAAPARGPTPVDSSYFPTGIPGLSFRIKMVIGGILPPPITAYRVGQFMIAGPMILELFKTSAFEPSGQIKAGDIGTLMLGPDILVTLRLARPINFTVGSCESPDVNVDMGDDYISSDFDGPGTRTIPVSFNLNLNRCPPGIGKVNYTFVALTKVIDASQGIVGLNDGSGAIGVGLQIRDGNDVPLALDTPHTFTGYDSRQGGSFQIPLKANYYRLTNDPRYKPGTANTELIFIMSYL
ncbi:fimbrial protein [Comamonas thiooxydans]|uniref:Fimbrial protein n=2 Tax=Comamonas thiooxydans TaxID=363952 RepID=A0A0E3BJI0_9BURK|nr:fimbrial protein [Comamonas thiooxydans]